MPVALTFRPPSVIAHLDFGRHLAHVKGEDGCPRKGGCLDIGLRHRPQVCSDQRQLNLLLRDLGDDLSETMQRKQRVSKKRGNGEPIESCSGMYSTYHSAYSTVL